MIDVKGILYAALFSKKPFDDYGFVRKGLEQRLLLFERRMGKNQICFFGTEVSIKLEFSMV